jgi:hypothetical protein
MTLSSYQSPSVDRRCYTVHEVVKVLPRKASILRQHNTQVGPLLRPFVPLI